MAEQVPDLDNMSFAELRAYAKTKGVTGRSYTEIRSRLVGGMPAKKAKEKEFKYKPYSKASGEKALVKARKLNREHAQAHRTEGRAVPVYTPKKYLSKEGQAHQNAAKEAAGVPTQRKSPPPRAKKAPAGRYEGGRNAGYYIPTRGGYRPLEPPVKYRGPSKTSNETELRRARGAGRQAAAAHKAGRAIPLYTPQKHLTPAERVQQNRAKEAAGIELSKTARASITAADKRETKAAAKAARPAKAAKPVRKMTMVQQNKMRSQVKHNPTMGAHAREMGNRVPRGATYDAQGRRTYGVEQQGNLRAADEAQARAQAARAAARAQPSTRPVAHAAPKRPAGVNRGAHKLTSEQVKAAKGLGSNAERMRLMYYQEGDVGLAHRVHGMSHGTKVSTARGLGLATGGKSDEQLEVSIMHHVRTCPICGNPSSTGTHTKR